MPTIETTLNLMAQMKGKINIIYQELRRDDLRSEERHTLEERLEMFNNDIKRLEKQLYDLRSLNN